MAPTAWYRTQTWHGTEDQHVHDCRALGEAAQHQPGAGTVRRHVVDAIVGVDDAVGDPSKLRVAG